MNIYVGNLPFSLNEDELRQAFNAFGEVTSAKIIMDRWSGKSRGFGFVEMATDEAGQKAIAEGNGMTIQGKTLRVNEARPREERKRFHNDRNTRW